jgi:DNA repair protein RadC
MNDEPGLFGEQVPERTRKMVRSGDDHTSEDRVREAAHDPSGHRARLRERLLEGAMMRSPITNWSNTC